MGMLIIVIVIGMVMVMERSESGVGVDGMASMHWCCFRVLDLKSLLCCDRRCAEGCRGWLRPGEGEQVVGLCLRGDLCKTCCTRSAVDKGGTVAEWVGKLLVPDMIL